MTYSESNIFQIIISYNHYLLTICQTSCTFSHEIFSILKCRCYYYQANLTDKEMKAWTTWLAIG